MRDLVKEINADLTFDLADEFYSNIKSDNWPTYQGDVVILNDRYTSNFTVTKAGTMYEVIPLEFMVLGQDQQLSDPLHTEKIRERCQAVGAQLIRKLMKDKNVRQPGIDITKISASVVKHLYDRDLSGVLYRVEFPGQVNAAC